MSRIGLIFLLMLLIAPLAHAYETDYRLADHFIMEANNTHTGNKVFEIWDVNLLRGLIDGKEKFIDFNFVRIPLLQLNSDKYIIDDIYVYTYEPYREFEPDKVNYMNGNFSFELGFVTKTKIKIEFNEDGSLRNITGSQTDPVSPDNVTVFKLSKDKKDLTIVEENKFINNRFYSYEHRTKNK